MKLYNSYSQTIEELKPIEEGKISMYVEYVAKKICEIKQLDESNACKQIEENFNSIFR